MILHSLLLRLNHFFQKNYVIINIKHPKVYLNFTKNLVLNLEKTFFKHQQINDIFLWYT